MRGGWRADEQGVSARNEPIGGFEARCVLGAAAAASATAAGGAAATEGAEQFVSLHVGSASIGINAAATKTAAAAAAVAAAFGIDRITPVHFISSESS